MNGHAGADAVVLFHLFFVVFAILGGLLVWRWRWLALLHVPAAVWAALVEILGGRCPLTPLEQALRRGSGSGGYAGGFVDHYIVPLVYPAGLTRSAQVWLGIGVIALNVFIYARLLRRQRSR